ncbi:butyrophilin subfamily 3 member A3-like isoform X1 [Lepisosteus oculatus]|uniref:butyrophilin subfamily 3 member A3-like isoform X1 n=1 Tax=Lepisosteus oculatus TaxID=7918 RepID=UPI00371CBA2D
MSMELTPVYNNLDHIYQDAYSCRGQKEGWSSRRPVAAHHTDHESLYRRISFMLGGLCCVLTVALLILCFFTFRISRQRTEDVTLVATLQPEPQNQTEKPLECVPSEKLKDDLQERIYRNLTERCASIPNADCKTGSMGATPGTVWRLILDSSANIYLDPSTAHPQLILSEGGKRLRCGIRSSYVHDNPLRFNLWRCVLATEGFTAGRHYWEVDLGENLGWTLGVSKESAPRRGESPWTPEQGYWTLSYGNEFSAETEPLTQLSVTLKPRKLGMFLDYDERQILFYNAESSAHIYTFADMEFDGRQKLYPIFCTGFVDFDLTITSVRKN